MMVIIDLLAEIGIVRVTVVHDVRTGNETRLLCAADWPNAAH